MIEINEIKKDLYKSKAMAKFSHYQKGKLFYEVEFLESKYQFPISTIQFDIKKIKIDLEDGTYGVDNIEVMDLSEDLGDTSFSNEIRGSELIRWIDKAIKNEEIKKVG